MAAVEFFSVGDVLMRLLPKFLMDFLIFSRDGCLLPRTHPRPDEER